MTRSAEPEAALVELRVSRALTDRRVVTALVGRYAARLESLAIEIHDRGVFAALCEGAFPALRRLELEGIEQVTPAMFDVLAGAMPALDELIVYQHQLPTIAGSRLAARIETLTLRGLGRVSLSLRGVSSLAGFARLRRIRLRDLDLMQLDTIDALAAFDVPIELAPNVADVTELSV